MKLSPRCRENLDPTIIKTGRHLRDEERPRRHRHRKVGRRRRSNTDGPGFEVFTMSDRKELDQM